MLGLLSQFYYFTHCLLIIIWYFFTIAPYSSCSLWHQPGTTPTPEELCTCSVTHGLEPNGSWHLPAPLPSPVLLIKFLCMAYTATAGRTLLSPRLFYIAVILMPYSCIAEAPDLMQLITWDIINGRWDMEILQKPCCVIKYSLCLYFYTTSFP